MREHALDLAGEIAGNTTLGTIAFDWNEPTRVIRIDVLQDKARELGVSSRDIANALNSILSGTTITQIRDGIYLIPVVGRALPTERDLHRDPGKPEAFGT